MSNARMCLTVHTRQLTSVPAAMPQAPMARHLLEPLRRKPRRHTRLATTKSLNWKSQKKKLPHRRRKPRRPPRKVTRPRQEGNKIPTLDRRASEGVGGVPSLRVGLVWTAGRLFSCTCPRVRPTEPQGQDHGLCGSRSAMPICVRTCSRACGHRSARSWSNRSSNSFDLAINLPRAVAVRHAESDRLS